jgi:DNA invertase Pin-like site-specific DNA recombinase
MLGYAREDDLIIVHSMDRLARNVQALRGVINELTSKKIQIQFIKENLTFTGTDSALSNLLLTLLGSVAEFELALIRERQLEGIAIAKRAGKYKGRKPSFDSEKYQQLKELMLTRKTKNQIARELGVSRFTLYRAWETLQSRQEKNGKKTT